MMKKLLLADDSITIQKVVGIIFATEDCQLVMTDNGDSAFSKALEDIPDLVIADISMPGKDGFELCRAIKSEPSLSNTSVLLLPGAFDHFDEVKAQEVGADGWLAKPFESQALLDKVSQLLDAVPNRVAGATEKTVTEPELKPSQGALSENRSVDEVALGLGEIDELAVSAAELDAESPDDIWDAVSFEEDDLQDSVSTSVEEPEEELSFAAEAYEPVEPVDVPTEEGAEEDVTANEIASELADEPEAASFFTNEGENDFIEEEAELSTEKESQTESFATADVAVEDSFVENDDFGEQKEPSVPFESVDEDGPVDFSVFNAAEAEPQETLEPTSEEVALLGADDEATEPLELADDFVASGAEEVDFPVVETEELEPLDLMEEDLVEQDDEFTSADDELAPFIVESFAEEAIQEVKVADGLIESEAMVQEATEAVGIIETGADNVEEGFPGGDAILDLSEDEIIVDESVDLVAEEASFEPVLEEPVHEEPEAFVVEEPEVELEPEAVVVELAEDELESAEELELQSDLMEDDGFYFDATAEEEEDKIGVIPAVAVAGGVAAATLGSAGVADSSIEQVEQQLRALSEDELKEVVARVAGPMIEKLAGAMLEQIAWEVVPDLAEAMISEEIRKIKQGTE